LRNGDYYTRNVPFQRLRNIARQEEGSRLDFGSREQRPLPSGIEEVD